jgi:hypothetical protein
LGPAMLEQGNISLKYTIDKKSYNSQFIKKSKYKHMKEQKGTGATSAFQCYQVSEAIVTNRQHYLSN